MIINNAQYGIELYIDNENGEEVATLLFDNFDELNAFAEDEEAVQKYLGCNAEYAIVEIIDGEVIPPCAFYEYYLKKMEKEEIDEIVSSFIDELEEIREIRKEVNGEYEFHLLETVGDGNKKNRLKNEFTYVCQHCMYELDSCKCDSYPYSLIQIDTKILPVIRELNKKGYYTLACCAGHFVEPDYIRRGIYILFKESYIFNLPVPKGWKYTAEGSMHFDIKEDADKEEFEAIRNKETNELLSWAEGLRCVNTSKEE